MWRGKTYIIMVGTSGTTNTSYPSPVSRLDSCAIAVDLPPHGPGPTA